MERPRLAIVYSTRDPAGRGAARALRSLVGAERWECPRAEECYLLPGGTPLAGYPVDQLYFEFLDETPDPRADAVIVLSKHSSASGRPTLTTHHTGNPTSEASLGGDPETLSWSAPPLSSLLLRLYAEEAEALGLTGRYEISLEATHHGPTRNRKPLVFIEIGSTPDEWSDESAQAAMARAVARALESPLPRCTPAAGYGGTHYPARFTRIHLEGRICLGHIIPKYAFSRGVPDSVIRQALEKSWPEPARLALVERKSLRSADRKRVERVAAEMGVPVEKA